MSNEPQASSSESIAPIAMLATVSGFLFFGWLLWLFFQFAASHPIPAMVALTVIFTVCAGVSSRQYAATRRDMAAMEAERQKRKIAVYDQFLGIWFDLFRAPHTDQTPLSPSERMARLSALHPQMLLWASDAVIQEYLRFRSMVSLSRNLSATEVLPLLEKLVIAMRRDVGSDENTQRFGDLLRQCAEDTNHI